MFAWLAKRVVLFAWRRISWSAIAAAALWLVQRANGDRARRLRDLING